MIPISSAALALSDRIEQVLQANLPTYVSQRTTPTYPLEVPLTASYIVGPEDSKTAVEAMGWPDVFIWVMPQETRLDSRATGDGQEESYNAFTTVWVSVVLREFLGVDLPKRNGREITLGEWVRVRAELYRGILMDILPRYVPDCQTVHECRLEGSGISDPFIISENTYREATVGITCRQHVSVRVS